jgi:hypothetical protein
MEDNQISFENESLRGKYAREIRKSFEENNLNYWWVSPSANSANKPEIFIQPRKYKEWIWENLPTISRISIQINEQGKPSFGVSGYNPFQIANTKGKFEERGYNYHYYDTNKYGKKEQKRWWLTKSLDNLSDIAKEMKDIEPLLFEKY